jgi:hypothetical protein
MKDNFGKLGLSSTLTNGTHAPLTNNVQMNGLSKRKTGGAGSSQLPSRPHKKRIAYMEVSDEEDSKPSLRNTNGANGVSALPSGGKNLHRRKSKGYGEVGKQLSLQEQRQQLPIARGTSRPL